MSGEKQNTGETSSPSPLLSFLAFWWRCCKSAASNSWGHYDHLTNVATIIQFLSVLGFVAIWIGKHLKGVDMNFWFLALPVGVALISFLVQLVRAPFETYRETAMRAEEQQQTLKAELQAKEQSFQAIIDNLKQEVLRLEDDRMALAITFENRTPWVTEASQRAPDFWPEETEPQPDILYYNFRIGVSNESTKRQAQDVRVELVSIEPLPRELPPQSFPIELHTRKQPFKNPPESINPGRDEYFHLAKVWKAVTPIQFQFAYCPQIGLTKEERDHPDDVAKFRGFILTVKASCSEAFVSKQFRMSFELTQPLAVRLTPVL
jgi:hypothetical protein